MPRESVSVCINASQFNFLFVSVYLEKTSLLDTVVMQNTDK